MMDYTTLLYELKDRILHVHFKNIKLLPDRPCEAGTTAYSLEYVALKLPSLGDVDQGRYISALTDIGYNGYACTEIEDKVSESNRERILNSLKIPKRRMGQLVIQIWLEIRQIQFQEGRS